VKIVLVTLGRSGSMSVPTQKRKINQNVRVVHQRVAGSSLLRSLLTASLRSQLFSEFLLELLKLELCGSHAFVCRIEIVWMCLRPS